MDTGLLATWLPFFLMLTRCLPTSRGMKEIPGPGHRLGFIRWGERGWRRGTGRDTHSQEWKYDFFSDFLATQCPWGWSTSQHRNALGLFFHTCNPAGLSYHTPMCYQFPRKRLKESPSPTQDVPAPARKAALDSPMWLLGSLFRRQGSSRPDGALMLAVRVLRSVSLMSSRKSAAEPNFTWEHRLLSSRKHPPTQLPLHEVTQLPGALTPHAI